MEMFWLLVLCMGLVQGSTIPRYQQHGHHQPYQYVDNQLDNSIDVKRMPDLGKSLERISDLERVFKDMSDSLKYREVQESIESLQLKVQNLQSKFKILEQNLEKIQDSFSSRGASVCTGETVD